MTEGSARPSRRTVAARYGRQHAAGGAIGSILNGSRKPRWDTRRATGVLLLSPAAGFTAAMALGAGSAWIGALSLSFAAAAAGLVAAEWRARRDPAERSSEDAAAVLPDGAGGTGRSGLGDASRAGNHP
ncbi:hypothetical protein LX16_4581 [Stackebrandtia albiflava]|uniref:Uncharacterized protein n=1 Tax=Stackebrandtia albiflava TaxID=406432 RepID=A0A562URV5_9ACTN|nr:hypothetical protein [Stackebrandtia albiflava]TWJ08353.1 hypothetical protein LX16_4581 [Stackebrandtia albiflava]